MMKLCAGRQSCRFPGWHITFSWIFFLFRFRFVPRLIPLLFGTWTAWSSSMCNGWNDARFVAKRVFFSRFIFYRESIRCCRACDSLHFYVHSLGPVLSSSPSSTWFDLFRSLWFAYNAMETSFCMCVCVHVMCMCAIFVEVLSTLKFVRPFVGDMVRTQWTTDREWKIKETNKSCSHAVLWIFGFIYVNQWNIGFVTKMAFCLFFYFGVYAHERDRAHFCRATENHWPLTLFLENGENNPSGIQNACTHKF